MKNRYWRIEDPEGNVMDVLGSYHNPKPEMLDFPDELNDAFNAAESVYSEINQDYTLETELSEAINSTLPSTEKSVDQFLAKKHLEVLLNYLKQISPYFEKNLDKIKSLSLRNFFSVMEIVFITYGISNQEKIKTNKSIMVMDAYLYKKAQKQNKKVGGLENVFRFGAYQRHSDEQVIDYLNRFVIALVNPNHQTTYNALKNTIGQFICDFTLIEELYLNEALDIEKITSQCSSIHSDDYMEIRNDGFYHKMRAIMKKERAFFIVGYAHLFGKGNLLDMFRNDGCIVTPLKGIKDNAPLITLQHQIKPVVLGLSLYLPLLIHATQLSTEFVQGHAPELTQEALTYLFSAMLGANILRHSWNNCSFVFPKLYAQAKTNLFPSFLRSETDSNSDTQSQNFAELTEIVVDASAYDSKERQP